MAVTPKILNKKKKKQLFALSLSFCYQKMTLQSHPKFFVPLFISISIFSPCLALQDEVLQVPNFAFSWLDDKTTYKAGDIATIKIKVLGNFDDKGNTSLAKTAFKPTLTVNGKMGNSSYISGVFLDFGGDPSSWKIFFTPILVGLFSLIINEDRFKVLDSSLHFKVEPGQVYPSVSIPSWMNLVDEFEAGSKPTLLLLLKDAFGNNISSTDESPNSFNFTVSSLYPNGSLAIMPNITFMGWNEFGYIVIEFIAMKAGNFSLHVQAGNRTLNGSPLPYKVNPGPIDVSNCVAKCNFDVNEWQIFSKMEIYIHQLDRYGNLVPGLYEFDADVVEKETNLSIPIPDLHFEEIEPGIQLFSFSLSETGNFLLTVSDIKHNKSISNMPYAYMVFVGYCDGSKSVVNGSGLNDSVAGETSQFAIYLNNIFKYPSLVQVEMVRVQVLREIDSYFIMPNIYPRQIINDTESTRIQLPPAPSVEISNTSVESSKVRASAFDVIYTAQESGTYRIHVLCGNIILNGGHSFMKEVKAGEVNITFSGVVKFAPKVPKLVKNEITVQLMDSFSNPVLSQPSSLKLEVASVNSSGISSWMFVDNNDGSYTGHYAAKDVGSYELCVSLDGKQLSPCPFGINVYSGEYFPIAYDDTISVWEDESIIFDALANDYFPGGNASIVEFSQPSHGSLLQYRQLLRYTPHKDYFGNDSFVYSVSDVNGNLASASVSISVLTIPPQFISFPRDLQATEDVINPRFGGYPGFELRYSDMTENISVNLSAQSGTLLMSPMLMQFWHPMWLGLSVSKGPENSRDLILEGCVDVINFALQSIQYLGNANFSGVDTIRVSTKNRNGISALDVPVFVEAINDPPFIDVPEIIILKKNGDEFLIFDKEEDKFSVGDPDLLNFPGDQSQFVVTFSVEVSDGFLLTSLPAKLINSTELKLKNSYQWQPLQTYVTISKHFTVKAIGIRFRGTFNDCNIVMQQLLYHGGDHGAVLTIKLNDMGHHGCLLDCAERLSTPLYTEATVNLVRRRPMSSAVAHTLGSAIIIELLLVFSLGVVLLFYTCKCAFLLVKERRARVGRNSEPSTTQKRTSSIELSEGKRPFTWCYPSNFRQRSRRCIGSGESSSDPCHRRLMHSFVPFCIDEKGES